MTSGGPPARPPVAAELIADPVVQDALDQAWTDSEANDPTARHEEGGWLYLDLATGEISVQRAARCEQDEIDLSTPTLIPGSVVVGKFHTHPNLGSQGWVTGPSADDLYVDAIHGVPDLIKAEDGIHLSGPDSRRGGLAGGLGFPP